jgi:serine/threonine protein kinase
MGEVYRASHAMLRRPTAVKLLNREKAKSEIALSRFEREVQITAELTHPNTIAVYDFGHTPAGEFYYAMEYIDGVTIHDLVHRGGPMHASRTIHVLRQVCGSLQEAHERGLIHRDIKPANIMLCERGGMRDVVKVLDFGLVKAEQPVDSVKLTRANALTGTPLYLPPEAATDPGSVDARSDLYALGAVAYFMLTGQPVFRGRSIVEIVTQHMTAAPTAPSEIEESVPTDLEEIVLQCLEKDPDARPKGAAELSERLAKCAAASEWTQPAAKKWWDENRATVMLRANGDSSPQTKTMTVAIKPDLQDTEREKKTETA